MRRLGVGVGAVLIAVIVAGIGFGGAWLVGLNPALAAALVAATLLLAALAQYLRGGMTRSVEPQEERPLITAGGTLVHTVLAAIVVLLAIQLIPAGRSHANPPVTGEPHWADPQARELVVRACYGCHSNEVEWPWYSNVAPLSWAVSDHVAEGREAVNYSEFDRPQEEAEETIEAILEGSMPPAYYTRFGLHSEANLSQAEIDQLVAWLRQTPGLNEQDEQDEQDEDD